MTPSLGWGFVFFMILSPKVSRSAWISLGQFLLNDHETRFDKYLLAWQLIYFTSLKCQVTRATTTPCLGVGGSLSFYRISGSRVAWIWQIPVSDTCRYIIPVFGPFVNAFSCVLWYSYRAVVANKKMDMWVVWSLTKPYLKDLACLNFNIIVGIANLASLS